MEHRHRRADTISIHALREEGDLENIANKERQDLFLSTPSARRATRRKASRLHCLWAISIHALREEGDAQLLPPVFGCTISIHALREEGDPGNVPCRRWRSIYFYPRPPRGGRRNFRQTATAKPTISIHALREEGDQALWFDGCHQAISIHALREEGDPRCRKA